MIYYIKIIKDIIISFGFIGEQNFSKLYNKFYINHSAGVWGNLRLKLKWLEMLFSNTASVLKTFLRYIYTRNQEAKRAICKFLEI